MTGRDRGTDPADDGPAAGTLRDARPPLGGPPGEIRSPEREIELAAGRERRRIVVTSRSARPVRVSSHYPFALVNARLEFDRTRAAGFRLDIPAGTTVRWQPGATKEVTLVRALLPGQDAGGTA